MCMCRTNVSWTARQSVHALTCPERRAHEDTSHALASPQPTRPHGGTQPQHNSRLHAKYLAESARSRAQHHAATTTTTTTTTAKLQSYHPREHHRSHNHADATTTTRPRATRQNTRQTPANEARVLKHDNAHPASKRTSAAESAQPTPPTHAGASLPSTRRPPTQTANINHHHHNAAMPTTHTHTSSHQRSTMHRSSSLLLSRLPRRRES